MYPELVGSLTTGLRVWGIGGSVALCAIGGSPIWGLTLPPFSARPWTAASYSAQRGQGGQGLPGKWLNHP